MSIAAAIEAMRAKGIADSDILDIVAHMASAEVVTTPLRTARQERNARYYASKKRLNASYSDVSDAGDQSPQKNPSPDPSKKTTPLSSEPSVPRCESARRHVWPEDFKDLVWSIYPRKTEKQPGMAALVELHRKDRLDWQVLLGGIRHLVASIDDPKFAPALHRWLKKARWEDQHPESHARAGPGRQQTFGQMAREAASSIPGYHDDQQPDRQTDFDGPTLDLVAGGGGADIVDLQPRRSGRPSW